MSRLSKWRDKKALQRVIKNYSAGDGKTGPRTGYPQGGAGDKFGGGTDDYLGNVAYNHTELRGKSRKATFDSPPFTTIQERKTQSVVDTGIMVDPTPDIAKIGLTEEQAADFIDYAKGYNEWMGSKIQHRREQMSFFQGQILAQSEKTRDGEYFFRVYYNYDDNLPHPLQWEALDADQFPDYTGTNTQDGFEDVETNTKEKYPADAIRKDERGRAKSYIIRINKDGEYSEVEILAKTKDGRYQLIHGFTPQYAFQTRGFPAISTILQDSKLLQSFSISHIQKAINQSQKVYAVYNKDQDPTSPFDEAAFNKAIANHFNVDDDGLATPDADAINYLNSPIFKNISIQSQPGSESLIMPEKGTEVKALENTAPVQDYDLFVGSFFSFLAAAENVPVEVALMKFGQNYSASRAALIMFWRICEVERQDLDTDLIGPLYEMYLAIGIERGYTSAPGWSDPRIKQWYIRHRIIGAPMPSIDPSRESIASLNQLGVGATSFTRNSQNLNGSDFEKNINENLEHAEKMNTLRLSLGLNKSQGEKTNG
ncbi:phage portal protein [bacterium]|nr:phage portal protein [bacterium]